MALTFRTYNDAQRYGEDYQSVRDFLLCLEDVSFPFGCWDWMVSHSYLEEDGLPKIGIWENDDALVGLVLYDIISNGLPYMRRCAAVGSWAHRRLLLALPNSFITILVFGRS